jgi:hypothetical protein
MNKKFTMIIFILLTSWMQCTIGFTDCKLLVGTIDLPRNFTKSTSLRIWHGGIKIDCDIDTKSKNISFEVSIDKGQTFLYLIFVNDIVPNTDNNTVKCLTIGQHADYKIFSLECVTKQHDDKPVEQWIGTQLHISLTRIPDDAIIVYIPGSFIDRLEPGSAFELPRIVLMNNLLEETIVDTFTQQLLKAINYDSLHASIIREIKHSSRTTLIASNT